MKELLGDEPATGQPLKVAKMNMIIPQVIWADKEYKGEWINIYFIPDICPICGHPTKIVTSDTNTQELYCTNPQCEGKLINHIDHFFSKKGLDAKGISEATIEKLISWGWVSEVVDLYNLQQYYSEWIKKPGFGEKSVDKILNTINESKNCNLDKFICALSIPLIGSAASTTLAAHFETWDNFRKAIDENYNFTKLNDFGYTTQLELTKFNYDEADKLAKIFNIKPYISTKSTSNKLKDKKVAITGSLNHFKNRSELQKKIEEAGGKVVLSVTKSTNILVNNDALSNSAKNNAAKKFNVTIMTEEDFITSYID